MSIKWKDIPMADRKTIAGIPEQSVLYIGFCLIGISIFIFGGLMPADREIKSLDRETMLVRQQLQEQKTLLPYMRTMREGAGRDSYQEMKLKQKGKLPREEISSIPVILGSTAKMSGMTIVSVAPRLAALSGDSSFLPVEVVLKGKFTDFSMFLIKIGDLVFLDKIDDLLIQQNKDGREYHLTLHIAVG